MRAAVVLVAAVTLVTACTPAASAPASAPPASAPPGSVGPSGTVPTAATPASPAPASSAPVAGQAASPSPSSSTSGTPSGSPDTTGLIAASPAPSGEALPPNPYELGGPAPVGSFVLGDSISLSAGVGPVLARLGYPVMGIVGQSASDTYLRTHLSGATAQAAPAWVIALGTNNTADPADVSRLAGWLETIDSLRSPGARQRVYWVTPHRPPSYIGSKSRWTMDAFNAELKRLDAAYGWFRIIDYDAVARLHPEWFEQDTAMHLHPDGNGQGVLVALIAGPDAVPVEIPAPLYSGPAQPGPEPETFDNSRLQPSPPSTPPPTPLPPEAPASPDASPDASSGVAASPAPVLTTTDEASGLPAPATAG
jgi:hypothetical protein